MSAGWAWDETLFSGSAAHYHQGRLPYAPGLAASLAAALGLDGSGRLLDVGCGPGSVTLLLAPHFEAVVGLDADADMVAEASRLAGEAGVPNASWVQARAEALPLGLGSFRVVTFAASFHWMDRPRVAALVRTMLDAGGALIHVDNHHQDGLDLGPDDDSPHPPPPDDAIADLRRRYLGPQPRAGRSIRLTSPDGEDAVFAAAGFVGPERVTIPDGRVLARTADDLVAQTFSLSSTAPHLFGGRLGAFGADLRALLAEASPATRRFAVRLPDNEAKLWRPSRR